MTEVSLERYEGGCHCGRVRYAVTVALDKVIECNCSHCARRGLLLAFTRPEDFTLAAGEGELVDYQFNRKVIHHLFCRTCGIESFGRGRTPDGAESVAINVRCLDGVDLATLNRIPFDGRSHS